MIKKYTITIILFSRLYSAGHAIQIKVPAPRAPRTINRQTLSDYEAAVILIKLHKTAFNQLLKRPLNNSKKNSKRKH